jgi:glycine cleavage system aminomethyltransferase T
VYEVPGAPQVDSALPRVNNTFTMSDPSREYRAAREAVALFDRSTLGKVTVTGRDRQAFLQGMLTNDVKGLRPGQGAPAAFLDAHGKVMALLVVYATADRVLLELPADMTEKTLQILDHYLISEKAYFEAVGDAFAILSLQGPAARGLLERVSGDAIDLAPYAHAEVSVAPRGRGPGSTAGWPRTVRKRCGAPSWERARCRPARRHSTCCGSRPASPGIRATSTTR